MSNSNLLDGATAQVQNFILIGKKLRESTVLHDALKFFSSKVQFSDTGMEESMFQPNTVFVLDNFEGSICQKLKENNCRILGPPVIIKCAFNKPLPLRQRPVYNLAMEDVIICFNGFRARENMNELADMVHMMGGRIRRDFGSKITHLVSNGTTGDRYRSAVGLGIRIMTKEWITKCYELKDDPFLDANDSSMLQYKMNPFACSHLSFYSFSREDARHMEEMTVQNGGRVVAVGSPLATHLVVNERTARSLPTDVDPKVLIVKSEWFWASIQMEACADENLYLYEEGVATPNSQLGRKTPGTPHSNGSNSRNTGSKRKRLRENLAQLAYEGESEASSTKRTSLDIIGRSSTNKTSLSFLDATAAAADVSLPTIDDFPAKKGDISQAPSSSSVSSVVIKEPPKLTPRQQTIMELLQTEKNYVGILHTIVKVFKEEIERPDQPGGAILDSQDVKAIFGGMPPIYNLHIMIRDKLQEVVSNWEADRSVGEVFLSHAEDLMRHYPNFINYFEKRKDLVTLREKTRPRFHAFLKVCHSKPECGRHSLSELLIRPVQRLPSVTLLLKDILKRTEETSRDYKLLQQALVNLEDVLKHINEDKRKAEGHMVMFEIVEEIENCPTANLLSAHRNFFMKVDATEVAGDLAGKGTPVTIFVFSDSLEICKRRSRLIGSRNLSTIAAGSMSNSQSYGRSQKFYKHLSLVQFSSIKRVVDICDLNDAGTGVFALVIKKLNEDEELYAFSVGGSGFSSNYSSSNLSSTSLVNQSLFLSNDVKEDLLTFLSKVICTNQCRTDYETLLAAVESHELNIDVSGLNGKGSFSKAASLFGKKMSRVFSINKTPTGIKRTVSSIAHMESPLKKESKRFGFATPTKYNQNSASRNTLVDGEKYSDLVDKVSIGTPSMQRRRETLASITFLENMDFTQSNNTPQNQSDGKFLTPLPIKNNRASRYMTTPVKMGMNFPSTQSLDIDFIDSPGCSTPLRHNRC